MMREEYHCHTCGVETVFVINGVPYCLDHAIEGVGVQARLSAVQRGMEGEDVQRMGEWAQNETASMLGIPRE